MNGWLVRFNIYFLLAVSIVLLAASDKTSKTNSATGSSTTPTSEQSSQNDAKSKKEQKEERKDRSTFRVHLEVNPDGSDKVVEAPVYRAKPVVFYVDRFPILDESQVDSAAVVDVMGGFSLQVQLGSQGRMLLENTSTSSRGQRIAIFTDFGRDKKAMQGRWLAAPVLRKTINSGVLVFTPDATREEAEQIARGLNNTVAERKRKAWIKD